MQSNFAKLAQLAMNTVRMDEASKIIGLQDESRTVLSTLAPLFTTVIDAELARAMEQNLSGLSKDDGIAVEDSKFEVGKSDDECTRWLDYIFMLTGNFAGVIKLRLTICTAPDKIFYYMQTMAQDDEGKVIDDNRIEEAEIRGIPLSLPMAVSMMLDACKKKGEA